ncbi:glucose-6-phosphate dehydrogenase [Microterricola viridarii]|uniref:Glucose-6-phosphate dehydrogenase n=1 Tax=Microterricola viridarii TaxID=412690 RepID=A0A120I0A4_9MICO|nr:glucose-6-phosphate dehydrogenase [Microterricola viridarii]AMB58070.1 glucose-6-phosphate dehydrogenase [Microterricola viridarii]
MATSAKTLIILGASGDLTARLLLPALGQLLTRDPGRSLHLLGADRRQLGRADWLARVKGSFAEADAAGPAVDTLLAGTEYRAVDVTRPEELHALLDACTGTPVLYFALPPAVTASVCAALAELTLPAGTTLALEKPFGVDEAAAVRLNAELHALVPEEQIHRVDHFLGRSTVNNLVGLRFANRIFEPLWNNNHIAAIDIIYDEQLGLEGRAGYYDKAGALVDMIQSHLLQVLAVLAMEPPSTLGAQDVRDAKGLVLRATRLRGGSPVRSSRRARYTAGTIEGTRLPAYVNEAGVDPARGTETLAELTLEVDTWRWAGVPFTLRSGKAVGARRREIVITFKPASWVPAGLTGSHEPTVLRISLAPDLMSLELNVNSEDDPDLLRRAALTASFGAGQLLAYSEVLGAMFDGDPTLSVRADAAEECWRIVAPAVAAWRADRVPLEEYAAGSEGPPRWPSTAVAEAETDQANKPR